MEENLLPPLPTFKLYNIRSIYVGTFLGGPLVTGYLLTENFKQLGETGKIKITWIIAILVTILLIGGTFFIPGIEKMPNYIIPIVYTIIAQSLAQKYQGDTIKTYLETGGQFYTVWRAVWIGLVGLALLLAVIFAVVYFTCYE